MPDVNPSESTLSEKTRSPEYPPPTHSPASSYYAADYRLNDPEPPVTAPPLAAHRSPRNRRKLLWFLVPIILIIILIVILVPVGLLVIKKKPNHSSTASDSHSSSSPSSPSSSSPSSPSSLPATLKNTIYDISTWKDTLAFNTTFTAETVGGLPIMGLNSSYDDSARPNEHVPPLNQPFGYDTRPIRGVNLGGWLVLEPFLKPSLFNYDSSLKIVDEYSLTMHLNRTNGSAAVKDILETHYSSFVNESTFREIAEAGLDHVRIPFGYWIVRVWPGDEFLPQVSWRYLLRGIEWARKYGLRVNLDLHSAPGGQNGWNHSGRQDVVAWLNGTNGQTNGERTLEVHEQLATFFSQPRYRNIVTIYGLVNEPRMTALNVTVVNNWTKQAYQLVQRSGFNGTIVYGDGFLGVDAWAGIFPEPEFPDLMLDVHEYTIFDSNLIQMTHSAKINYVCNEWTSQLSRSSNNVTGHGATFVGEWSQADTDCTPMLNNVGVGARWDGTYVPPQSATSADLEQYAANKAHCPGGMNCSCAIAASGDVGSYSAAYKAFLLDFAEAQMHVFETSAKGYMYWNWDAETYNATQWSYRKGREIGILPKLAYERQFNCSGTRDYVAMGLPEYY